MAQHDYAIANQSGAAVRADINALAEAIASLNGGAASPSVTFPLMFWYDETTSILKQRNPANTAWIDVADISGSSWALKAALLAAGVSGDWFGTSERFARIDTSGIMELGATLDFHPDAAGTEDYRTRLSRATGANGALTLTQTGTGGINVVPGTGKLKVDGTLLYGLPIGTPFYWPTNVAPSGAIFGFGQNVSRSTYSDLFSVYSTTYGAGDGSTTFGMPDYRGRTIAGKDDMGGTSANRLTAAVSGGINGDVLGAVGGAEWHVLTVAELAAHAHTGTTGTESASHAHTNSLSVPARHGANGIGPTVAWSDGDVNVGNIAGVWDTGGQLVLHTHSFTSATAGSTHAHNNVQPTIIQNVAIWTGVF